MELGVFGEPQCRVQLKGFSEPQPPNIHIVPIPMSFMLKLYCMLIIQGHILHVAELCIVQCYYSMLNIIGSTDMALLMKSKR